MGGITPIFNANSIKNAFKSFEDMVFSKELQTLIYVGEDFVNNARSIDTYKDRTGNLRSSIGYLIGHNGKVVHSNFTGTAKGISEAKKLANSVLNSNTKGFVLIGVAGMEYALSVESKGYDVITGSAPIATDLLKDLIERISS